MISKPITYLVISDLHLGKGNLTPRLISNGKRYLTNSKFTTLDILYIAGDGFDKLLDANTEVYNQAMSFLSFIVKFCTKYNIKLRYLEGTTLHDWNQAEVLYNIIQTLDLVVDFKYISSIHIEYFTKYNLYTLYIPDNMYVDANDTYRDVKVLMGNLGITKVDNVIIHGQFNFQLPIIHKSSHNESDYINITNGFIHTGHIHTSKIYKTIIGNGSLDRLSHGEEEKKGGYLISWVPNKLPTYDFIVNRSAIIFKTIWLKDKDISDIYKRLDKIIYSSPISSHYRLKLKTNNDLLKDIEKDIKKRYKDYHIKVEKEKGKEEIIEEVDDNIEIVDITSSNIMEVLLKDIPTIPYIKEELQNCM